VGFLGHRISIYLILQETDKLFQGASTILYFFALLYFNSVWQIQLSAYASACDIVSLYIYSCKYTCTYVSHSNMSAYLIVGFNLHFCTAIMLNILSCAIHTSSLLECPHTFSSHFLIGLLLFLLMVLSVLCLLWMQDWLCKYHSATQFLVSFYSLTVIHRAKVSNFFSFYLVLSFSFLSRDTYSLPTFFLSWASVCSDKLKYVIKVIWPFS